MKILKLLFVFLFVFSLSQAHAQYRKRDWHVYAGPSVGGMYYVGDLKETRFAASGYTNPSIGLRVMSQYKNLIAVQGSYTYGSMSGYDTLISRSWAINRAYEFTSRTHDLEVLFKYTFFNQNKRITRSTKFVFYPKIIAGFGVINFKPMREYQGEMIDLRALGTEGQYIDNPAYPDPYGNWALGFKLGNEISIVTGKRTTIDIFGYYTFAQTDYLDDVGGGAHINVEDLAQAPNADVLAAFAYPRVLQGNLTSTPGNTRGSSEYNDGYYCFGIAISYRLTELAKGSGMSLPPLFSRRNF
mgnify:CR=1 FL=1